MDGPLDAMIAGMTSRRPPSRQSDRRADSELLIKGMLLVLIGLGVLISPYFIESPGMQGFVAHASLVGWFALVLGAAFVVLYLVRRARQSQ